MGRIVRRSGRPANPIFHRCRSCHFAPAVGLVLPGRKAMCFNVATVAAVGPGRRACLWLGAALVLLASGCTELRGRRRVREGNRLYREGRYQEAVAVYEQAESLIPNFWLLWLNKGLTCRQLMIPGSRQSTNQQATNCALNAFEKLRQLRPADQRGDSLYVQTLFDGDRFQTLADLYQARLRTNPERPPGHERPHSGLHPLEPPGRGPPLVPAAGGAGREGRRSPVCGRRVHLESALSKGGRRRNGGVRPTSRSVEAEGEEDASARPGWATSWARSACDWPMWASRIWSVL